MNIDWVYSILLFIRLKISFTFMISNFILAWHISRHKSNRLSQLCALTALRIRHEWTKTKGTPERNYTQPVVQSNDEYLGGITHVIATNCRSVHFWTRRPSQPTSFFSSSSSKRLGQKEKKEWRGNGKVRTHRERFAFVTRFAVWALIATLSRLPRILWHAKWQHQMGQNEMAGKVVGGWAWGWAGHR